MALPTIAEIDAAVPAAGTPNRALTNAVLKGMLPSRYLGQVATRGKYLEGKFGAGTNQMSSRIQHFATENMRGSRLRFVNYYGTSATSPGAAATVTVSLEYPAGTINRVKFSGSNTGTIADGGELYSDPLDFDIPAGAFFYEHCKFASTVGALYCLSAQLVDKSVSGASTPDNTATGAITGMFGGNFVYGFTEAVGYTDKPTVLIIGDSREAGAGDVTGYGTNCLGASERALGTGNIAFVNVSCSGAPTWQFAYNSPAKLKDIANRVSHIIIAGGINDINGGNTAAQTKTNFEAVIAAWNPSGKKPTFILTVDPYTTGTYDTAAGQTIWDSAKEVIRVAHNLQVRQCSLVGQWGCFDTAIQVEDPAAPGKWKSPGYTTEGLHGSTLAAISKTLSMPVNFGAKAFF